MSISITTQNIMQSINIQWIPMWIFTKMENASWTRLARDICILFFVFFFLLTPPEFNAPALLSDLSGSSGVCDWNFKYISRRDVQFQFNWSPRWRRTTNFSSASFCSWKISCWPCSAFGWMFVRFDTTQLDNWLS